MRMIRAAPTTPVSWVFAPERSATAVRDPLVLTGKPWNRPAARFAAPMPIISWLPLISCPVRAANADAVEIVSARETRAMPDRPGEQRAEIGQADMRDRQRREALGEHPDQADAVVGQVKDRRRGDREHHHDQHRRDLRQPALQHQDHTIPAIPTAAAAATASPLARPLTNAGDLADQAVGIDLEPEQLRQLPDQDGQRQAVHVADHRRLGDQVGDEAELGHARQDHDRRRR